MVSGASIAKSHRVQKQSLDESCRGELGAQRKNSNEKKKKAENNA